MGKGYFLLRFKNRKRGFTLLELLIAAVILFVALGLAIGASSNLFQSNELSYQVVIATEDAHRVLEQMRKEAANGSFPSNVVTKFPQNQAVAGFTSLNGEQVTVAYVSTTSNPLNVTVTVTWNAVTKTTGTRVVSRQLNTLMTKR